MKKASLIIIIMISLLLQGCAYELGYALGGAQRYSGIAAGVIR